MTRYLEYSIFQNIVRFGLALRQLGAVYRLVFVLIRPGMIAGLEETRSNLDLLEHKCRLRI